MYYLLVPLSDHYFYDIDVNFGCLDINQNIKNSTLDWLWFNDIRWTSTHATLFKNNHMMNLIKNQEIIDKC